MRIVESIIGGILMYLAMIGTMLFLGIHLTESEFKIGAIAFFLLGIIVTALMHRKVDYTKAGPLLLPIRIQDAVRDNSRRGTYMTEAEIIKAVRNLLNRNHETDTDIEIKEAIKRTRGLVKLNNQKPPTYRNEVEY